MRMTTTGIRSSATSAAASWPATSPPSAARCAAPACAPTPCASRSQPKRVTLVGVEDKLDLSAAMEAVMVSREQDRMVFRELFDAWFRDPELANKLLAQMLPSAEGKAEPSKRRPRVREALSAPRDPAKPALAAKPDKEVEFDAAMTSSDRQRLQHADFNALGASEYRLVERLARDIRLPIPSLPSRRLRVAGDAGQQHARMHWPGVLHEAARTGGEILRLPRLARREQPLPLLVLVDVSGSMERYARLLLAFLHASTRRAGRRDVFAFGTRLTDLTPAFRLADTDAMLGAASLAIDDFAGGTRLGSSLTELRRGHARRLTGRRTLVLVISDGLDTGEPPCWKTNCCGSSAIRAAALAQPAAALRGLRPSGAWGRRAAPASGCDAGGPQSQCAGPTGRQPRGPHAVWPLARQQIPDARRTKRRKTRWKCLETAAWASRNNRPGKRSTTPRR
jgi:uncharacterized protein with von Willebrand factor type A (vWA) domain